MINGTIPLNLPTKLDDLSLDDNLITGSFNGTWPSGLTQLWLNDNFMSGYLPLDTLPSTLHYLFLGTYDGSINKKSRVSGRILLNRPQRIRIARNSISDLQIQNSSALQDCILDDNPLLNNPNIAGLTMCSKNNLYSPSIDCPAIVNIAEDLNMEIQQPGIMFALRGNCCIASGITCNSNNRVIKVQWHDYKLDGIVSWEKFPPFLEDIWLNSNSVTGPLPNQFPMQLKYINLGHNKLYGNIPNILPVNLNSFSVDDNQISGIFNGTWPAGLTSELWLNDNMMYGSLPVLPPSLKILVLGLQQGKSNISQFTNKILLNKPNRLNIAHNLISDVQILNTSDLVDCDLSFNPLLNNPNIVNLTMCTMNGLYSMTDTLISSSIISPQPLTSLDVQQASSDNTSSKTELFHFTTISLTISHITASAPPFTGIPIKWSTNILYFIKIGIKWSIDIFILAAVLRKTPFRREFKKLGKKQRHSDFESLS